MFTFPVGHHKKHSTGGSLPTLPVTSGLLAWYLADFGVTNSSGVTAWADQSGNSHDWSLDTTEKPQVLASYQNSLPVIRTQNFGDDARIQRLTTSPFLSGTQAADFFVVIKAGGIGADTYPWQWSDFSDESGFIGHYAYSNDAGTQVYDTLGANTRYGAINLSFIPALAFHVLHYSVASGSGGVTFYADNISYGLQPGTAFWNSAFKLFNFPNAKILAGAYFGYKVQFDGYLGELIIYNRNLNSTERTNTYNYLKTRWGL